MLELAATPFTSEDGPPNEIEILSQVMGNKRHGRVNGLGLGPTPSTVFGPFSKSSARVEMEQLLRDKLKEQDAKLKEQDEKHANETATMQTQMAAMQTQYANAMATMQTQMAQLMNIVAQSQPHLATLLVSIIDSIFFLLNLVFFS